MIKNIIFDFGDVFINLDKKRFAKELASLGISEHDEAIQPTLHNYEMGLITTDEFLTYFKDKLNVSTKKLIDAWTSILLDAPQERLSFLKDLVSTKKYRIFLLSNTNHLHINWIKNDWGMQLYTEFKNCFEKFYLSQEIHFRKPNADIYEFVLKENKLVANETLFVDDTKVNTDAAQELGIHVWNINPDFEDVTQLLTKKAHLF